MENVEDEIFVGGKEKRAFLEDGSQEDELFSRLRNSKSDNWTLHRVPQVPIANWCAGAESTWKLDLPKDYPLPRD